MECIYPCGLRRLGATDISFDASLIPENQGVVISTVSTTICEPVKESAREIAHGSPISRESALRLIHCSDEDLPALLSAARAVRDNFKPGIITYSRKVFLPLTNLCRDYCGYCTFRRDPRQAGAHTMTPDEVLAVARGGEKLGCTEALFSLGDKPELVFAEMREELRQLGYKSTLHYLEAMCELILRETRLLPHPNPGLLSAEWVERLAAVSPSMGLMLETTNTSLLAPGAAHDNAPDKVPGKRLHTIEEAGKRGVPFTTGVLIGIGETAEDRVETLLAIRDLHDRYAHIQEVIVQNFRAKASIPMARAPEPSRGEMLRAVAVARLLMPKVNIQAPPNLNAPYYEDLLDAGINDWGGVSPLTPDYINPEKPWPHVEQLRLRTERKGLQLRQRLPVYPEFLRNLDSRPALLRQRLEAARDGEGLAIEQESRAA
jgi:7,8-didemethyl-8-hydroxy-5-deazariboflavin synthase CofG subunit